MTSPYEDQMLQKKFTGYTKTHYQNLKSLLSKQMQPGATLRQGLRVTIHAQLSAMSVNKGWWVNDGFCVFCQIFFGGGIAFYKEAL